MWCVDIFQCLEAATFSALPHWCRKPRTRSPSALAPMAPDIAPATSLVNGNFGTQCREKLAPKFFRKFSGLCWRRRKAVEESKQEFSPVTVIIAAMQKWSLNCFEHRVCDCGGYRPHCTATKFLRNLWDLKFLRFCGYREHVSKQITKQNATCSWWAYW